jgi:hypothetical protein
MILALLWVEDASANLVQNGTFSSVSYSGSLPLSAPYYGQIGPDSGSSPASGATLTVANWSTGGYNFVFNASNVDRGTQASGAQAGQPEQAPGQFNAADGYGNTFMWGSHNGGASTWTAPPSGGNFIAADGAFEQGAITQTITGLTVGKTYVLKFYYGAAQQESFDGATTDQWTVSMGTGNVAGNFKTPVINLAAHSFSGWSQATMYFYANSTTETLSFLASGTPNGEPPFSLLAGVTLEVVPDCSSWLIFAGFGSLCIFLEMMRRRRRQAEIALAA